MRTLCAVVDDAGHGLLLACLAMPAMAMAMAAASEGVASYCRFSSKAQDERTIADQQRQCRERAARDGYSPDGLLDFADEAVSGAAPSRAGFDKMMAAARAGRIQGFVLRQSQPIGS